jgi:hypothetical protein
LRSKFRIQVLESEVLLIDTLKQKTSNIRDEFKISSYLVIKKGNCKILIGDFTTKDNARYKLTRIKKVFPKAKVVHADNESIIYFQLYEKKKEIKLIRKDTALIDKKTIITSDQKLKVPVKSESENSFDAWNDERYLEANTAADENYLTQQEKEVFYYLNLVRMNPKLFADTYLLNHTGNPDDEYETTLYNELHAMDPLPCLKPNKLCWESAKCHAKISGESGYVGHERENCTSYFWGECCQYGPSDPLAIILQLLIDRGVTSLGHRRICLGSYTELGVSIQPHIGYGSNAVLDFR